MNRGANDFAVRSIDRTLFRNVAVAIVLFMWFVAIDYLYVHHSSEELERIVFRPLGLVAWLAVSLAFWWVNCAVYSQLPNRLMLRVGLVTALTVSFLAVAAIPLLWIRFAIGGSE